MHFVFDSLVRGLKSWTHGRDNIDAYRAQIRGHLSAITADVSTAQSLEWVDQTPGSVFAQAATSVGIDEPLSDPFCDKISEQPGHVVFAAAGLTALPPARSKQFLKQWLGDDSPVHSAIALIAAHHLGQDVAGATKLALASEHPVSRIAAVAACAGKNHDKLTAFLRSMSESTVAAEQFAAADALARLDDEHGLAVLETLLENRTYRWAALRALGARLPEDKLRDLARKLAGNGGQTALAARLAGYAGRTNAIPRLLEFMEDAGIAPYAAEAFSFICGFDYAVQGVSVETPEEAPLISGDDEGVTLPYPDVQALNEWWQDNQAGLNAKVPLLLGRPREDGWIQQVDRDANMHVTSFTRLRLNRPVPTSLF